MCYYSPREIYPYNGIKKKDNNGSSSKNTTITKWFEWHKKEDILSKCIPFQDYFITRDVFLEDQMVVVVVIVEKQDNEFFCKDDF